MTLSEINVLVGESDWAWPRAIENIFAPRGVNSIVAANATDALDIISSRRIHTAIVDMDSEQASGLSVIRIIHGYYPLLPCILVSSSGQQGVLAKALELDVFSVINKPVDMAILLDQLNRLFTRKYRSMIFSS